MRKKPQGVAMTEIPTTQIPAFRPDMPLPPGMMPLPTGDSGFAALTGLIAAWPAPAPVSDPAPEGTAPPPPPDALAQWLDDQGGVTAQLDGGLIDPAIAALDAALPQLPEALPVLTEEAVFMPPSEPEQPDAPVARPEAAPRNQPTPPEANAAPQMAAPPAPTPEAVPVPRPADDLSKPAPAAAVQHQDARPAPSQPVQAPAAAPAPQDSRPMAEPHQPVQAANAPEDQPRAQPLDPRTDSRSTEARPMPAPAEQPAPRPAGPETAALRMPDAPDMTAPARTAPASATAMPDQPRPVVQQVAEALVTSRADRTEIALSPEELGRLRVVFTGPDRTHVTIWAERPETLDLVRRNADLLAQQLADAGIGGGSMEFRRDDRPEGWGMQARDTGTNGDGAAPAPTESLRLSPRVLSDRRLDIRI